MVTRKRKYEEDSDGVPDFDPRDDEYYMEFKYDSEGDRIAAQEGWPPLPWQTFNYDRLDYKPPTRRRGPPERRRPYQEEWNDQEKKKPDPKKNKIKTEHNDEASSSSDDDDDSDTRSDYEEEETVTSPRYTPSQLVSLFESFYRFLTTLHYASSPSTAPRAGQRSLLDMLALDPHDIKLNKFSTRVFHRLPCFPKGGSVQFDYGCMLIDTTHAEMGFAEKLAEKLLDALGELANIAPKWDNDKRCAWVIPISYPYLGDGEMHLLDTLRGEMICFPGESGDSETWEKVKFYDVAEFFDMKKEQYRTLARIPCRGHPTMQVGQVPEREGKERITDEEVMAQEEEEWGTDVDVQFVRQVYRDHGWPDKFRREECFAYIDDFVSRMEEEGRRESWEWDKEEDCFLEKYRESYLETFNNFY
ncbi:hypothetical protein QBC34DRAFT_387098 [Podospora aff. communis PSN243]|uniref:Uncharacterized protein n=1 Tax=Podospora aff. communis PSN243 TaxID=3040156 RepID=A0AAV9G590_9PEZI|nr:hypothetical protein QBC34DRAFT_387098 [Podospora aff. communis PSN243]